jgi:hypothetical protein
MTTGGPSLVRMSVLADIAMESIAVLRPDRSAHALTWRLRFNATCRFGPVPM